MSTNLSYSLNFISKTIQFRLLTASVVCPPRAFASDDREDCTECSNIIKRDLLYHKMWCIILFFLAKLVSSITDKLYLQRLLLYRIFTRTALHTVFQHI